MKDPGNSKKYFGWTNHPNELARNPEKIDINYHNIFFTGRNTGKTDKMIKEIIDNLYKKMFESSNCNVFDYLSEFNFIAGTDTTLPKEEATMSLFRYKPNGCMEQVKHVFDFELIPVGKFWKQFSNDVLKASMIPNERKAPIGPIVPKKKEVGQPIYTGNKDIERKHLYTVGTEIIDSKTEKTLVINSLIPMNSGEEPRYYAKFKNGKHSHIVKESEITLEED